MFADFGTKDSKPIFKSDITLRYSSSLSMSEWVLTQESIPVGCQLPACQLYFTMNKFEYVWLCVCVGGAWVVPVQGDQGQCQGQPDTLE